MQRTRLDARVRLRDIMDNVSSQLRMSGSYHGISEVIGRCHRKPYALTLIISSGNETSFEAIRHVNDCLKVRQKHRGLWFYLRSEKHDLKHGLLASTKSLKFRFRQAIVYAT